MSSWFSLSIQRLSAQQLIIHNFICMHLLSLRDGSPYHPLPSDAITWELPPGVRGVMDEMAITSSRVMISASYSDVRSVSCGTGEPEIW